MESRQTPPQIRNIKESTGELSLVNEPDTMSEVHSVVDDPEVIEILSSEDEDDVEVISHTATPIDVEDFTLDEGTQDVEITRDATIRRRQSEEEIQILQERALPQELPGAYLQGLLLRQFHGGLPPDANIQQLGRNVRIMTPLGEYEQEDERAQDFISLERRRANPTPAHLANSRRVETRRRHRQSRLEQQREHLQRYRGLLQNVMSGFRPEYFLHSEYTEDDDYNDNDDAVENSIMQRIERENERQVDTRLANEQVFNRKTLLDKQEISKQEILGYTNDIKENIDVCCELCGVILGDGIEDDFKPDPRYNNDIEKYMKMYRVHAPWFCIKQCTQADIDLSKRIFRSRCGHVFCGRCVRNIGNKPRKLKATMGITIDNPQYYAPKKCPAPDCKKQFTVKGFQEAYF